MRDADGASERARAEYYQRHYRRIGRQMVRAALRAHATVDAAHAANGVLQQRLRLRESAINVREIAKNATLVLQVELMSMILREAQMPRDAMHEMVDRLVSDLMPRRDGFGRVRRVSAPELSRQQTLESMLMRESSEINGGRGGG